LLFCFISILKGFTCQLNDQNYQIEKTTQSNQKYVFKGQNCADD
jgi:hypothetical protein